MILATTIAPVDLSFLIVAPLWAVISEWKDDEQTHRVKQVKRWRVKRTCLFYYSPDKLVI